MGTEFVCRIFWRGRPELHSHIYIITPLESLSLYRFNRSIRRNYVLTNFVANHLLERETQHGTDEVYSLRRDQLLATPRNSGIEATM